MYLSRVTNRNKVGRLGLLAVAMTATLGVSAFAQDPGPIEESSIAVIESVLSSAGVLVDNFGCNTQAIINYSGRITLGEGWSAQMQGLWGDTSLTLNYFSNSPDGYHFNVGGGGNFGSLPWTIDTAQAAFANVPPQTRQIGLGDAKVLFIGNNPDWHWWKRFVRLPDGSVIDWGAFTITRDGIPQMTYVQRSYSAPRNPGEPGPHAIYATADWQTACEFRLDGTTTESPSGADNRLAPAELSYASLEPQPSVPTTSSSG